MIEQKTAPRISLIKESPRERAFKDLESQVCDLKSMSIITELAIDHGFNGKKREDGSGDVEAHLSWDEFNSMHFAVIHLGDMIRKFNDDYFACFEADGGA